MTSSFQYIGIKLLITDRQKFNYVLHKILLFFQICSYFTDPLTCIGPVATNQVRRSSGFEHTAGEKRLSGHPDDFLRMK